MLECLFNYIVFPGFLFTSIIGLLASWVDRKVTALVQWRLGPPWYQPFMDLVKLSIKEITIPKNSHRTLFLSAPLIGLSAAILASTMIWLANIKLSPSGFAGDIVVIVYLLTLPSLALILGASASSNPLASLGASREIKLMLAYELPFIITLIVPIIKTSGILRLGDISAYQMVNVPFIYSPSGILAVIVWIFCIQAKLGLVPFDAGEAETEIMGGMYIEYSGILLAVYKLTKAIMMVTLPLFLITIFWPGTLSMLIFKYILFLVIIILIRNTNPRVRIDHAIRFFWRRMSEIAMVAVLLAILGK